MHRAEGVLFRDALVRAAEECGLRPISVPENQLMRYAESELGVRAADLLRKFTTLGKSAGPPWAKDQKDAAVAAMIALAQAK